MSLVSRFLEPEVVQRLNALGLSGRRVVEGAVAGVHRSPVRGASVEFRQHRPYVLGDEPRRLDWRVLARTDRPYVRQYEQETNLRAVLVLDASGSMGYGGRQEAGGKRQAGPATKFEYAAKLTAALAYLMLASGESVGLAVSGQSTIEWVGLQSGTGHLARVIGVLERTVAGGPADLRQAMHDVVDRLGRRSMVVIVSDFFAPVSLLRDGLARLRHGKHEVIGLRVLNPDEIEFPFRTWSQFRGMEGERSRLIEPAVVRRGYLSAFAKHRAELEQTCRSARVELHTMVTDHPMVDALLNVLQHRRQVAQRNVRR